ncbi:MAG: rhodanese-like domain-containing protein [Saprospiraceae bacterium]|nr:rhodanese-like domain-containing protein [Saprospiraceae bacterium]
MDFSKIIYNPNATLVDVREPYEFAAGHAAGAINIPLNDVLFSIEKFKAMSAPIVVYCRSGNRSEHAKLLLQAKGIQEVYNGGGLGDVLHYQAEAKHVAA